MNKSVQHDVNPVGAEEPKHIEKTVSRKKPTTQKRIKESEAQFIDKFDDVPRIMQRQVSTVFLNFCVQVWATSTLGLQESNRHLKVDRKIGQSCAFQAKSSHTCALGRRRQIFARLVVTFTDDQCDNAHPRPMTREATPSKKQPETLPARGSRTMKTARSKPMSAHYVFTAQSRLRNSEGGDQQNIDSRACSWRSQRFAPGIRPNGPRKEQQTLVTPRQRSTGNRLH